VFSLIYIELEGRDRFNKFLFVPVLGIALLCCGSKLMIVLTGLFYAMRLFKKRPYFGYAFLIITFGVILLFAPTRKRFQEIVNPKSFSILKEDPILSKHDERLTGVTVRLIIWQESLETFDHVKRILVGQGVDQKADRLLQDRLTSRNVDASHIKYDPHNQYITTLYKLGLAGLLVLVLFCVCVFRIAYLRHNRLLLFTMLLFVIAMFTESVLQRATGIFFFLTLILLQTFLILNPTHLENSNPGDQGNS
jgi:O-antigen ligase